MATTTLSTTASNTTETPPLTTKFSAPASCIGRFYYVTTSPTLPVITSGILDPLFNVCQAHDINYTFSPGMCPELMEIVTRSFNGSLFTEICCQSGFAWDPRGCSSSVSRKIRVFAADGTIVDGHITVSSVFAVHDATTVFWGASDLSLFPADVSSNRVAIISNATRTDQNFTSTGSVPTSTATGSGLSLPARVGVGVGIAVGAVLMIIIISAWLCKVKRRRRQLPAPARNGANELDGAQPVWKRLFGREWRAELPPDEQPAELATAREQAELTGLQVPIELPGSYDYYLQPATGVGEKKADKKEPDEKKASPGNPAP